MRYPSKHLKSYLGNSSWLVADSLLTNAFGLIVLAVVARYLGPKEYGSYAYVFAIAQLFAVVGQMGLDGLLTRELIDRPDDHAMVLGTAGGLRFIGYGIGGLACLIYAFVVPGHTSDERWLFGFAFLFILFTPGPALLENWFRSRLEARYSSASRILGTLVGSLLKIGVVLLGLGVVAVGAAQAASVLITFAISFPLFLRQGGPRLRQWRLSGHRMREILSESWILFLGSLFAMIYLKIDQVMLRWWEGAEMVGTYAIAVKMSELCYFLPNALVSTFFPRLIKLKSVSSERFAEKMQDLMYILVLLSYAIMIGFAVLGKFVIIAAFGRVYAEAYPVLMICNLTMPFIFMRYAFMRWIIIERQLTISTITQGVGAVMNVLINIVLIPKYGMIGAAMATLISYTAASYFALLFTPSTRLLFVMMTKALLCPWRAVGATMSIGQAATR